MAPDITITVGASYDDAFLTPGADVCFGTDGSLRIQSSGGAPPYTYTITGDNAPAPFDVMSNDTTIYIAGLSAGTHSYVLTDAEDNCTNHPPTVPKPAVEFDVDPIPVITSTNNAATVCNNGSTNIDLTASVDATEISWTITAGSGASWNAGKAPVAGSVTKGVDVLKIAQQLQHTDLEPVTVTYSITSAGPGGTTCAGNSLTEDVVVPPTPIVTSASTLNMCNSTAMDYNITSSTTDAGLSFEWDRAFVIGISNPAADDQTDDPITETLVNTTAEPIDVQYKITPKIMGCDGVEFTLTVTVNPTAVITSDPTKSVCDSVDLAYTITTSTTQGTIDFDWTRANVPGILPATGAGTGTPIDEYLDNTTTEPLDVDYIITPSVNGCDGDPFTLTVTVNPTTTVNSVSFINVCDDSPIGYTITSPTADPGLDFNWTRAVVTDIDEPAGAGSGNTINESLDNISVEPINVEYEITPTINGCDGIPFTLTVRVNPTTTVNSSDSVSVCNSTPLGYTITSPTTDAAIQFDWSRDVVANISNLASSATGSSINESLNNTSTEPVVVEYDITPSINGCDGEPFVLKVRVNPTPVVTSANTKMVCDKEALDYTITSSTVDPGLGFNWTRAAVTDIDNPAGSGTGNYINEQLDNTGTGPVNVVYLITPVIDGCNGTQFTLTVTVNPTPLITSAASANACDNTALGYTITSSTPGAGFVWNRAAVTGIYNAGVTGQNANPINEALDNTTTGAIDVVYKIVPSLNSCDGDTFLLTVTVNPTAVITSPAADTICDNTALGYAVTSSTADPGLVINWTRASVPGITPATGTGSGFLINETLDNGTTEPVTVDYIITPRLNGCDGSPFTLKVLVNPTPQITSPNTATVCDNVPLGYTIGSSTASGDLEYSWSRNAVGGISESGRIRHHGTHQ